MILDLGDGMMMEITLGTVRFILIVVGTLLMIKWTIRPRLGDLLLGLIWFFISITIILYSFGLL